MIESEKLMIHLCVTILSCFQVKLMQSLSSAIQCQTTNAQWKLKIDWGAQNFTTVVKLTLMLSHFFKAA